MDLSKFGVNVKKCETPQTSQVSEDLGIISNKNSLILKEITDINLNLDLNDIKKSFKKDKIERFLPWFLKYQVKNFDDLIITSEIKKIINFIEKRPKNKGLLLVGRAGSGKTTTLNLLGEKYNFEIFELNASDARNKKSILESVGDVLKQKSLFGQDKMILIDEADGVSGNNDRGGLAEIIKLLKISNYPLVFTANDKESDKIKALKKVCVTIDFENHSIEILNTIANKIFKSENIIFDEKKLKIFIEERNTIDIRGFINDLQASTVNNKFTPNSDLELRDYKKKIENLLEKIYYSYPEDSYKSSFNTSINLDDLFLYLEENTHEIYSKTGNILAFNELAKADIFRGRIRKWQYWRYLVYISFYLTFGVSNAKTKDTKKSKTFKRNDRILKKWIYGNKYNPLRARTKIEKSKNIELRFIEKLAKSIGRSANKVRTEDIFYFAKTYQNNLEFQKEMDLKFSIDESTKKVLLEL